MPFFPFGELEKRLEEFFKIDGNQEVCQRSGSKHPEMKN